MATPTPLPSFEKIIADGVLVNGNLPAAHKGVVELLKALLPGTVEAWNIANTLTGHRALIVPKPDDVDYAPGELSKDHVGKILVGMSVQTTSRGSGAFRNDVTLQVHCVGERVTNGKTVLTREAMAERVREVMFQFLTDYVNADGVTCWRQLMPTGYGMMEGDWAKNYSGTTSRWTMTQAANYNGG